MDDLTFSIDKNLLADGNIYEEHPENLGWCPHGKHLACCYTFFYHHMDGSFSQERDCYFYIGGALCNRPASDLGWFCCKKRAEDPDPMRQNYPDPNTCERPGEGQRPKPSPVPKPPSMEEPNEQPGNPVQEPVDQKPWCRPRTSPSGL